jgi:hypothetical protein
MPVWISTIADIIGILGGIFALFAWQQAKRLQKNVEHEKRRLNQKIAIVLQYGVEYYTLKGDTRRAEITRAEVLGRVGALPMKNKGDRYSLEYVSTAEFIQRIQKIQEEEGVDALVIPCKEEEFEKFDLK